MVDYSGSYAVGRADLGVALMEYQRENGGNWIGTKILTPIDVMKDAATFSRVPRSTSLQTADNKIGPSGTFNRVDAAVEDDSYACLDYGLEGKIRDRDRAKYASDFDAEKVKVAVVDRAMKVSREIRIKNALFNTGTWTGASLFTDRSAEPWATPTSDIPTHASVAREKVRRQTGLSPDTLVVGKALYESMLLNQAILAKIQNVETLSPELVNKLLASILGVKQVLVGDEVYDATGENQDEDAEVVTDVWGATYAMFVVTAPANASIEQPCLGRSINWAQYVANMQISMYREEQSKSDIVRIEESAAEKIFDPAYAHLIQAA